MDAYNFFETSNEDSGIYINYIEIGCRVKVARQGGKNTLWEKEMTRLVSKHDDKDLDLVDNKELKDDMLKAFVRAVILDWEVCDTDKSGRRTWKPGILVRKPTGEKEVCKPTFDNILQVLRDLPMLYDDIQKKTADWKKFRKNEEEATIKN